MCDGLVEWWRKRERWHGKVVSEVVVVEHVCGNGACVVWWLTLDSGLDIGVAGSVAWRLVDGTAVAARAGHGRSWVTGVPNPGPWTKKETETCGESSVVGERTAVTILVPACLEDGVSGRRSSLLCSRHLAPYSLWTW